jgi:hypothetical protein
MLYIGVDPGYNYSGLAILSGNGQPMHHAEYANPVELWRTLSTFAAFDEHWIAIEDFIGSGTLNKERKQTIEVLGYVRYRCAEFRYQFEIVVNQVRLAYVSLVPRVVTGKDEISAYAHALALKERKTK